MVSLSPSTDVTVPEIDRPAAPRPPKKPPPFPPGTKLPVGPLPPPTKPPLKLPRPPVVAAAGAVVRPIAKATPPMANTSATPSRTFSQRPDELGFGLAGGTTGWTGWIGAIASPDQVGAAAGEGATPGVAGAAGCGAGVTGCEVVGSSAMSMLSLLFVAQGADGVEAGGLAGRPHAEHHPDREAEEDGDRHRARAEGEPPAGEPADQRRDAEPDGDADEPAEEREGEGLGQA